jgi:hypothetical protein
MYFLTLIYFQGNLKGSFSVILFNASVAILTGSKPEARQGKLKYLSQRKLTIIIIW